MCDRAFSMISPRKRPRSSCFFLSVISLGGWVSFKPNFEAQLALEVPRRAFRPSFPISLVHRSTIGECASPLSTLVGCRPQIDSFLSPVFGECLPKHAFNEASKESTVRRPNGQVRAFVDRPLPLSLSTGPWAWASRTFSVWNKQSSMRMRAGPGKSWPRRTAPRSGCSLVPAQVRMLDCCSHMSFHLWPLRSAARCHNNGSYHFSTARCHGNGPDCTILHAILRSKCIRDVTEHVGTEPTHVQMIDTVTRMYNFLFVVHLAQELSEKSCTWPTFLSRLERKIEACVAVEVPRTLIADCACILSVLDVLDAVLRRELASIGTGTRLVSFAPCSRCVKGFLFGQPFVSRLESEIEACVAVEVPRTLIADCACASFQSWMC